MREINYWLEDAERTEEMANDIDKVLQKHGVELAVLGITNVKGREGAHPLILYFGAKDNQQLKNLSVDILNYSHRIDMAQIDDDSSWEEIKQQQKSINKYFKDDENTME